ncbi:MAG: hypothetical protein Q9M37_05455 [Desulfonauticus sp.]|nr:hypothetical protein [Desulfonauticus sp.]
MIKKDIQGFYDQTGNLIGVFISAKLWEKVAEEIDPILEKALSQLKTPDVCPGQNFSQPPVEPIEDWENFLKFWDFRYPVEKKVICKNCGLSTEDWTLDSPRKFILKAANLGGLVSFLCTRCQARVIKRHFKDKIQYEVQPFTDRKK